MKTKNISSPRIIILLFVICALSFFSGIFISHYFYFVPESDPFTEQALSQDLSGPYRLARVVDGDTLIIKIDDVDERVRLIGVDTPESVHPDSFRNSPEGIEASDFVKSVLGGSSVFLEYDISERDRYDRLLAYVYFENGSELVMLNSYLLQNGIARISTYPPNVKHVVLFTENQNFAIDNLLGFWESGFYG